MGVCLRRRLAEIATVACEVLRALSICAAAALVDASIALAQAVDSATLAVDIPAQPLAQALAAFARQTGLQLVYVSGVVGNQKSRSASAGLSTQEALARMLQGTGLRFEYLTPHSVRIRAASSPASTVSNTATVHEVDAIIVTANRRDEDVQDVAITMHVLTNAALAEYGATTFDDFVKHLPGVTVHGVGPGQNNIYIRGLATGEFSIQTAGANGSFPNVAVFLDEQSVQLPGRNLDIYTADLERVEVLEGPQGTLFGAGAQAGVLRYITNKPKLNVTEAMVNAGSAMTAHGEPSRALEAVINVPIASDKLAVRGVIYNERRGGYIDNVPGTFARAATDLGIHYAYAGGQVPANSVVINNSGLVARSINSVTYEGLRVETLYRFNENWNALLTQSFQDIRANGVFAEMTADSLGQPQRDLTVQLYNPSFSKDRFENSALTIDGRVGVLEILYAGSYLVRNVEQVQDYTNYARGAYADYYQCVNPGPTPATARCFTPSMTWRDLEHNTHQSHDLRLSTPGNWRVRGVGGLFYENSRIQGQTDWFYLTALPYFNPIGPPTGYYAVNGQMVWPGTPGAVFVPAAVTSNNPNVRPPGDAYFADITRGYKHKAAYASVDLELVPRTLTLTTGTRYSSTNTSEVGSNVSSFGCKLIGNSVVPSPCLNRTFTNLDAEQLDRTSSGFRSRANLSWKASEDALLYYTWSQGFRAGGFNRAVGIPGGSPLAPGPDPRQAQALKHGGWAAPVAFAPDNLTNNEVGWKTRWLGQRLQWDGAVYREDWDHTQVGAFATGVLVNAIINGGNYRVRGVETSGAARVTAGLTIEVGAAWNHSELVKEASFWWADGMPIDFSVLQTPTRRTLPNPAGSRGDPLAGAPPFQGTVRARYEATVGGYSAFAQIGAVHQSHSIATIGRLTLDSQGNFINYNLPPFTSYDGALGVGKDAWFLQIYGENLTDARAELYSNYHQWYKAITVNRPRTIGLRVSYKLGSS